MKFSIAYLLMRMPAPSEVFLSLEVRALVKAEVGVEVLCLRTPHQDHKALTNAQGLAEVPIYNFPYVWSLSVWRDVRFWLKRNPQVLWKLLALITKICWRRPLDKIPVNHSKIILHRACHFRKGL